ncbi:sigma-54-dependent Fis family transcriptional regulator [Undibacterium sp. CY7W]|uniref:Sigma-54-dependent Fis family transcriptional regulator n=1 Tax=Undibacterium rugosum TaxID=2762291 RepID=A0A923I715_9BURK|nr:sigma 54-interacting transcriptional regulator [Undibacterium rugosum]MBC3934753.1 sigma-54-dependent Fis family transcriptional regulator [Undibacterium rugosum]
MKFTFTALHAIHDKVTMSFSDHTMTSPSLLVAGNSCPMLGLTIAWHPDSNRVGEQFIVADPQAELELSRFSPAFRLAGKEALPLGHGGISREALRIQRNGDQGVLITPPASRMVVEVNGVPVHAAVHITREQLSKGLILGLGRAVLICLHWMQCLPKMNEMEGVIGVGSSAILLRDQIRQVANTDFPVLLLGETGTGKEIAARGIHQHSQRRHSQMVTVNMAALNESLAAADLFGAARGAYTGAQQARKGLFAEAENATLFLDEIGNTPASIQPMLLRVLETGDYRPLGAPQDLHASARLIAATDQDLYGENFNQALLRRLESFVIHLPPLRERREDIGILIQHLLRQSKLEYPVTLPTSLISDLLIYDWPGNIRQLSHVLRRILLALQAGQPADFHQLVGASKERSSVASATPSTSLATKSSETAPAVRKKLTDLSEDDVLQAMIQHDWYIQGAAQELGISRPSMYKLLEQHSQIRKAEQIPVAELRAVLDATQGVIEQAAHKLKTPAESLRRYARIIAISALSG